MRVLFQSRKTLWSGPGGDTIQIAGTKTHLERLGVKIDVSTELQPDIRNYDLVHIFNLMRPQESYLQVKNAKRKGKKVALSTIYGLYTDYEKKARGGILLFDGRYTSLMYLLVVIGVAKIEERPTYLAMPPYSQNLQGFKKPIENQASVFFDFLFQ